MDILKYEKSFKSKGYHQIVGIDEAGRGPLAGPVVAVAVNWGKNTIIEGVKDSKKISEKKRLLLFDQIQNEALDIGIGIVHEKQIDKLNILQATYLAMRMAIGTLKIKPDLLLIDGNKADIHHIEQQNIIKGDSLSYSIACASIIAKVTRDSIMYDYDKVFPDYGFKNHKGYGTKFHIEALKSVLSSPIHRKSFKPINSYLPTIKNYQDSNSLMLLGKQLIASNMIKNNYQIINFNDQYDLICKKQKTIIIVDIQILMNGKTINSKSQSNKLNFDGNMKDFLSKLEIIYNRFRLDRASVNLTNTGPQIKISKGLANHVD